MKEKSLSINYSILDFSELNERYQNLLKASKSSRENAYAPNSKFKVGAALLLEDGSIVLGNNQENIASPSGLCAERVALFYYGSLNSKSNIKAIAVSAQNADASFNEFISPCGACLQVMAEYEQKQDEEIEYLLYSNTNQVMLIKGIKSLMPFYFKGIQ